MCCKVLVSFSTGDLSFHAILDSALPLTCSAMARTIVLTALTKLTTAKLYRKLYKPRTFRIASVRTDFRCPAYLFQCRYGACVNGNAECDGKQDCKDNSDETSAKCGTSTSDACGLVSPMVMTCLKS